MTPAGGSRDARRDTDTGATLEPHPQGTLLRVRAQAGARRNGIRGVRAGELMVAVTQVAEQGKANQAIIQVLSAAIGTSKSQIELVAGVTSAHKRFLVQGISAEELACRLAEAQEPG